MQGAAKKDLPDAPKLTNSTSVLNWAESMVVHETQGHFLRGGTLAYLTCPNVNVTVDVHNLEAGQQHSVLYGSIEGDMTHHFSTHMHCITMIT